MRNVYPIPGDFEAIIRILTESEGGGKTSPFNGIRWDFCYASDDVLDQLYMIRPDFYGPNRDSLSLHSPLPRGVELPARMIIVVDEMREVIHRSRIKPGTQFYCHEGAKRVAIGRVTCITGLHKARPSAP